MPKREYNEPKVTLEISSSLVIYFGNPFAGIRYTGDMHNGILKQVQDDFRC